MHVAPRYAAALALAMLLPSLPSRPSVAAAPRIGRVAATQKDLLRLRLPPPGRATLRTLHDNGTLVLTLDNYSDASALQNALATVRSDAQALVGRQAAFTRGSDFSVDLPPPNGLRLYLTLPDLLQSTQGTTKGGLWTLHVTAHRAEDALRERIMHYYVPQLGAAQETADSLRHAEALLLAGRLTDATDSFNDLLRIYPLRPWAALRLADVTLLRRGHTEACNAYLRVHTTYGGRSAGLVAGMHAAVLGCRDAPTNNREEWESLLLRSAADDASSRWLAAEAHWALTFSHDVDLLQQALAYGPRILGKATYDNLFLKTMVLLPPMQRASFARANKGALNSHPDAADLHILEVQALCELDLSQLAAETAEAAVSKTSPDVYLLGAGQCNADPPPPRGVGGIFDRRAIFAALGSLNKRMQAVRHASSQQQETL